MSAGISPFTATSSCQDSFGLIFNLNNLQLLPNVSESIIISVQSHPKMVKVLIQHAREIRLAIESLNSLSTPSETTSSLGMKSTVR